MKLYLTAPLSLSKILPVLQNLGLEVIDERPFAVSPAAAEERDLYDLGEVPAEGSTRWPPSRGPSRPPTARS